MSGEVVQQLLGGNDPVRAGFGEMVQREGGAIAGGDQPEVRRGLVCLVGEAAQRGVGEGVGAGEDQVADVL